MTCEKSTQRPLRVLTVCLAGLATAFSAGYSDAADPSFVGSLAFVVDERISERLELSPEVRSKLMEMIDRREMEALELVLSVKDLPPSAQREKLLPFVEESERMGFALLTVGQRERLQQIRRAQEGMSGLAEPATAESLSLTAEQRDKVQQLLEQRAAELTKGGESERRITRAIYERKLASLLTESQRAAWERLAGLTDAPPAAATEETTAEETTAEEAMTEEATTEEATTEEATTEEATTEEATTEEATTEEAATEEAMTEEAATEEAATEEAATEEAATEEAATEEAATEETATEETATEETATEETATEETATEETATEDGMTEEATAEEAATEEAATEEAATEDGMTEVEATTEEDVSAEDATGDAATEVDSADRPAMKSLDDGFLRFNFSNAPWKDVLEWLADEADLSLAIEVLPLGTFSYRDDQAYTVDEALDLVNSYLLTKGFTLIRRQRILLVIDTENPIPEELMTLVTLDELDTRGRFELVKCLFPLAKMKAEDAESMVEDYLGPHGNVIAFPQARQILVAETVGKLRVIRDMIRRVEDPSAGGTEIVTILDLKYVSAEEVLMILRPLLGLPEEQNSNDEISLSVDPLGLRLFVTGNSDKMQLVRELVPQIDKARGGNAGRYRGTRGALTEVLHDYGRGSLAGPAGRPDLVGQPAGNPPGRGHHVRPTGRPGTSLGASADPGCSEFAGRSDPAVQSHPVEKDRPGTGRDGSQQVLSTDLRGRGCGRGSECSDHRWRSDQHAVVGAWHRTPDPADRGIDHQAGDRRRERRCGGKCTPVPVERSVSPLDTGYDRTVLDARQQDPPGGTV